MVVGGGSGGREGERPQQWRACHILVDVEVAARHQPHIGVVGAGGGGRFVCCCVGGGGGRASEVGWESKTY